MRHFTTSVFFTSLCLSCVNSSPGQISSNDAGQTATDSGAPPGVDAGGTASDSGADSGIPPQKGGRLGAELCPDGPFPPPLPENPTIEVFVGQTVQQNVNWEGVVWVDNALYWSEIRGDNTAQINRKTLTGPLEQGVILDSGSNGLALDSNGNLLAASQGTKGIAVFALPGGAVTPFRNETYQDKRFNSPNDLVLHNNGSLYFTDPDYQAGGNKPQNNNRVYRIAPNGDVSVVYEDYNQPNGITLSPDGTTLYIAGDSSLQAFALNEAGVPSNTSSWTVPLNSPDGMTVDCAGNIYATENAARKVQIFSPAGVSIGTIESRLFTQGLTNVAFGGPDRKTLFISGFVSGQSGGIYRVDLNIPGLSY